MVKPDTVPNLVGERLDVAAGELDDLGILSIAELPHSLDPVEEDPAKWEVCATRPKAGKRVPEGVELIVARIGRCEGRRE